MSQQIQILLAHYVMGFIDQYQLVPSWVELGCSVTRHDALYGCDGDIGGPRSMVVAHLEVNVFVGVCEGAVTSGLFHQLAAVGQYKGLGGISGSRESVDEVGEDDLEEVRHASSAHGSFHGFTHCLAGSGGQRHAEPLVALCEVGQHRLDAFFLVLAQRDFQRREGGQRRRHGGRRDFDGRGCASTRGGVQDSCRGRSPACSRRTSKEAKHEVMASAAIAARERKLRVVTGHGIVRYREGDWGRGISGLAFTAYATEPSRCHGNALYTMMLLPQPASPPPTLVLNHASACALLHRCVESGNAVAPQLTHNPHLPRNPES